LHELFASAASSITSLVTSLLVGRSSLLFAANSLTLYRYNNHIENGNCEHVTKAVGDYLFMNGVSRLFVGHQPHGDCPSVICSDNNKLTIFMNDTSYSDMTALKESNPANNRGSCYSNVTIAQSWTHVSGVVKSGKRNDYLNHVDFESNSKVVKMIGKRLEDGSWVKGIVEDKIVVCKGEGFRLDMTYYDNVEDLP